MISRSTRLYKEKLKKLISECAKQGLKVKFVPDEKTKDFVGMNPEVGKDLGVPIPNDEIWIDRQLSLRSKVHTLKHELQEHLLMKNKKKKYWSAHGYALRDEKKV